LPEPASFRRHSGGAASNDPLGGRNMTAQPMSLDSYKCRKTLTVGKKTYTYYSLLATLYFTIIQDFSYRVPATRPG
jgi:hypothetical protein